MKLLSQILFILALVSCSSTDKAPTENESEINEFSSLTCPDRVSHFKRHYKFNELHRILRKIHKEFHKSAYKKAMAKMPTFPGNIRLYDFTNEKTLTFLEQNRYGQAVVNKAMTRLGHYEEEGPSGKVLTPPHYFYDILSGVKVSLYLFKRQSGKFTLLSAVWPIEKNRVNKGVFNFFLIAGQKTVRVSRLDEDNEAEIVALRNFCP